jgi:hypothetical protein
MSLPLLNGIPFLGGITLIQNGRFYDGSAASPSISFQSNPATGFYYNGGPVGLAFSGVNSLFFGQGGNIYSNNGVSRLNLDASGAVALVAGGVNQNVTLTPSGSGRVNVNSSYTGNAVGLVSLMAPSMTAQLSAGYGPAMYLGTQESVNNALCLDFIFDSSGSVNNRAQFGVYGSMLLSAGPSCVMIGTIVNSGNGILQLGTHTTSAGGIGFGTDCFLHRVANNVLSFGSSVANPYFRVIDGSIVAFMQGSSGSSRALFGSASNHPVEFQANSTTAGTIDTSGNWAFAGSAKSSNATGGIGYATGAGTQVTQTTSKATAVSSSKVCGKITTHNASLAANTNVAFTFNNTAIAATDLLVVQHVNGGTMGAYVVRADCAAGSATITIRNITAAPLGEAIAIRFALIKATEA